MTKNAEEFPEISVVKCTVLSLMSLSKCITKTIAQPEDRRGEERTIEERREKKSDNRGKKKKRRYVKSMSKEKNQSEMEKRRRREKVEVRR